MSDAGRKLAALTEAWRGFFEALAENQRRAAAEFGRAIREAQEKHDRGGEDLR
jgi:hypothetical protein